MITREEYELLKSYRDKGYKWIARDKNNELYTHKGMLIKYLTMWDCDDSPYTPPILIDTYDNDILNCIKWKDEKPTEINDLIRDYEAHQIITSEKLKVTVPQFIALWIEGIRAIMGDVSLFDAYDNLKHDIWDEVRVSETDRKMAIKICRWICDNSDIFIDAWREGYEVEKEKLYIVELPNPNKIGNEVNVLMKNGFRQIVIKQEFGDGWKKEKGFRLTEAEIKKDFEWAWQFAGEVE